MGELRKLAGLQSGGSNGTKGGNGNGHNDGDVVEGEFHEA
jgi:hypothetical protein